MDDHCIFGACAAASMLLVYGVFEISGDAKAVCAGRKLWRLQWSPLCREKGRLHDSVSGSSFAGTGLLPKKLEVYYLCRHCGCRTVVLYKRCFAGTWFKMVLESMVTDLTVFSRWILYIWNLCTCILQDLF